MPTEWFLFFTSFDLKKIKFKLKKKKKVSSLEKNRLKYLFKVLFKRESINLTFDKLICSVLCSSFTKTLASDFVLQRREVLKAPVSHTAMLFVA